MQARRQFSIPLANYSLKVNCDTVPASENKVCVCVWGGIHPEATAKQKILSSLENKTKAKKIKETTKTCSIGASVIAVSPALQKYLW